LPEQRPQEGTSLSSGNLLLWFSDWVLEFIRLQIEHYYHPRKVHVYVQPEQKPMLLRHISSLSSSAMSSFAEISIHDVGAVVFLPLMHLSLMTALMKSIIGIH
jgi:hypothetical protein